MSPTIRSLLPWIICVLIALLILVSMTQYLQQTSFTMKRQQAYLSHDNEPLDYISTDKTRIYIFFGTRPEIIKMAPLIRTFSTSDLCQVTTVFTGQHPDLIKPFLRIFDITVDVWFNDILERNQSITDLISKIMMASKSLSSHESDIWLVQGDTSTAFAIATVAFHRGLRIAHVEAGLRTFNMYSPFPEEFNRKTISSIATFHFAPTENNRKFLLTEGVQNDRIFVTGNTVIDAVKYLQNNNKTKTPMAVKFSNLENTIMVLITLHRRENINMMSKLYSTIQKVSCPHCLFIVPVHPNPNAGKAARTICQTEPTRFICVPPLSYEEVHWVMNRSQFILTDSGGLQEEATWYHVPTLVLRTSTERMEAVEAGAAVLVGQDLQLLEDKMSQLIDQKSELWKSMSKPTFPFGYGNSSDQIRQILENDIHFAPKNVILTPNSDKPLPPPGPKITEENLRRKVFTPVTMGIVLQVFKRNSLQAQLEAAVSQTLRPQTIVVLQNGHFVDVLKTIKNFRRNHPNIELQHIASSKNLRFHARFHLAYMLNTTYVSIWDDDVLPRREWLEFCVTYSKTHANALVGANGRTFKEIGTKKIHQIDLVGRNDFIGHTWTLPREFLKYYVDFKMLSLHTGEDIQLAFALQKVGIECWRPKHRGLKSVGGVPGTGGEKTIASWKQNQSPRELLFCKILEAGFKPLKCSNCQDKTLVNKCINKFENNAKVAEKKAQDVDAEENKKVIWTAVAK